MKISKGCNILSALIIFSIIISISIGPIGESIGATQPKVGRIVVLADDWPISDSYWSTSTNSFTLNTFSWLTEFSSSKRILRDAYSDPPIKTKMVDTLQSNGYTVTILDTSSWTPTLLATYNAVFIEYSSINHTLLTEYVMGGGGVFLIGGHYGSEQLFNEFLSNFGMSLQEPVFPGHVTLTSFEPHSVTTGVSALETLNPTPILVHSNEPTILASWGDWNWLVTYSIEKVPTTGLVAYYQFEYNVRDSVGSNHGSNHGATYVEGKIGTALHFDGVDDYVEIPDAAVLRLTPPFTLEAWVHPEDIGSETIPSNTIICKVGAFSSNEVNYGMDWQWAISPYFAFETERASDDKDFGVFSNSHSINQWYHVVGLYDGTTMKIYVNGVLEGEKYVDSFLPYTGSAPLQIGGVTLPGHGPGQGNFKGVIDEVRIYNRALSKEEVAQHYQAEITPSGVPTTAGGGDIEWQQTYDGTVSTIPGPLGAYSIIQTADEGFILAGRMDEDAWLVKTDSRGNIEWQQTYGGSGIDATYAVIQTADGGFALAGYTCPEGTDPGSGMDFWLVKTDARGNMEWNRTYNQGGFNDFVYAGIQTADGGFVLAGRTAFCYEGCFDAWLVKTDVYGNIEWQQTYGGDSGEGARAMIQTADGGFALAGRTFSYGAGMDDFWLVKTDAHGNMEWQQTYGGAERDGPSAVIQTMDGGFMLAGYTTDPGAGDPTNWLDDIWLVKTDAHGTVQWSQTYGGSGDDEAYAVIQMEDGGFILAGRMGEDAWLAKIDSCGNIEWQQTYGGAGEEAAQAVIQTVDEGFAFAGHKDGNAWLVKITPSAFSAPSITIVSPNGGESWSGMHALTWTATDPQADPLTYTVSYSPNGGQTWTQLATGLNESSYLWDTTTVVDGTNYLIKVEATDGSYTRMDLSNGFFEIANKAPNTAPSVQVIRPNGGEEVRTIYEIQWNATDLEGDPLTYTISYSPNGGDTWTQLASEVTGTSYHWDTSGVQVGENYLVKIEASDGRLTAEDCSDAPFTVEREIPTETRLKAFFVPSFRVVEVLGALFVLLDLGKRRKRWKMLLEE
ncbi:MAG: LamG-like jellyroll fold domain-containing protein [Candidatus Heimdallarchaeota archaeon]